jgi:hypothetical protein
MGGRVIPAPLSIFCMEKALHVLMTLLPVAIGVVAPLLQGVVEENVLCSVMIKYDVLM